MASASTVREWAHSTSHPEARGRGKLSDILIDDWNASHPDDPYGSNGSARPSLTAEQLDDLFDDEPSFAEIPEDTGETKPRPVPRARAKPAAAGGLFGLGRKDGKAKKKPLPRVSTESLISGLWRAGAKLAAPLPPLYRTLRIQAPVAGVLLEDAVKGTVADTVLQPLARMAEAGKTVQALLGPPLYVTGLTLHASQAAARGENPNPLVMTLGVEGLRSSLMAWMDIAGPKFEQAMKHEREFEDKYGAQVDAFIGWLLSPPPSTPEEAQREEMMFARATGQAEPEPATM